MLCLLNIPTWLSLSACSSPTGLHFHWHAVQQQHPGPGWGASRLAARRSAGGCQHRLLHAPSGGVHHFTLSDLHSQPGEGPRYDVHWVTCCTWPHQTAPPPSDWTSWLPFMVPTPVFPSMWPLTPALCGFFTQLKNRITTLTLVALKSPHLVTWAVVVSCCSGQWVECCWDSPAVWAILWSDLSPRSVLLRLAFLYLSWY